MFLIIAISHKIFAIDTRGAVICSLGHGRKHMLTILPTTSRPGLTNTLGIMLQLFNNYPFTRLAVRIIGAIKRQFFLMVTHVFDNSNLSQGTLQSKPEEL